VTPSTFQVTNLNDSGPGSLRAAVMAANANPGADTIRFGPAAHDGTIPLTSGQLTISDDLTIDGPGENRLTISGTNASRVFRVIGNSTNVTLRDLTITGGSVTGANGGGILAEGTNSYLTLISAQVIGNSATGTTTGGNGGGIYTLGQVALEDSAVGTTTAPNTATGLGGGIWAFRGVSLDASTVEGNLALIGGDGGGIVVNSGDVSLTNGSAVSHNSAEATASITDPKGGLAGGIFDANGSVFVSGSSSVEDNHAFRTGGILVGYGDVDIDGGSTLDGNVGSDTAFGNGGILDVVGNVTVSDHSRIKQNISGGMGSGGIVVVFGDVSVSGHSQIIGNMGNGPGGGIAANFDGQVTVTDSVVNHNTGGAIGGGIVNFSGPHGGVTISHSQVNDNTLTDAMTLQQVLMNFFGLLPGVPFQDLAAAVGGEGGASMSQALQQVSQAVDQASPQFAAVLQGIGDQHPLVIGAGIGTFLGNPVLVANSEVSGNSQVIASTTVGLGGGIAAPRSSITIDHSAINDNVAHNGAGGGLWVQSGPLTIEHSSVNGNSATGNGGGIWNASVLSVLDSTVSRNRAGGDGGGLFNTTQGQASVSNSTFRDNQATGNGGGMANRGTLTVVDSRVVDNQAGNTGGGIWNRGELQLIDVFFAKNSPDDVDG
jgi:hypothetical protein